MAPGLVLRLPACAKIRSDRGSTFYRCRLSDSDPRFPKYPRLPVLQCAGYIAEGLALTTRLLLRYNELSSKQPARVKE